jgi:hypothetical protein
MQENERMREMVKQLSMKLSQLQQEAVLSRHEQRPPPEPEYAPGTTRPAGLPTRILPPTGFL